MNHELRIKKYNLEIGRLGENIARKYLEERGYKIIDQNYKNKYAEIDLIVKDKGGLVFVEVKTRIGEQFGTPEQSINKDKMQRLIRNAQAYMAIKNYNDIYPVKSFMAGISPKAKLFDRANYRIDAICIVLNQAKEVKRINHYENITE